MERKKGKEKQKLSTNKILQKRKRKNSEGTEEEEDVTKEENEKEIEEKEVQRNTKRSRQTKKKEMFVFEVEGPRPPSKSRLMNEMTEKIKKGMFIPLNPRPCKTNKSYFLEDEGKRRGREEEEENVEHFWRDIAVLVTEREKRSYMEDTNFDWVENSIIYSPDSSLSSQIVSLSSQNVSHSSSPSGDLSLTHIQTQEHTQTDTHEHTQTHTETQTYTQEQTQTHTERQTQTHTERQTQTHTQKQTHNTHIQTHTHAHTHTQTQTHTEEKLKNKQELRNKFSTWILYLRAGLNLLFYGLGSKKIMLEQFAACFLSSSPVIFVNAYMPAISLSLILKEFLKNFFALSVRNTHTDRIFRSIEEQVQCISDLCRYSLPSSYVFYIFIHNLDAPSLCSSQTQEVLSTLASLPNIRMVCMVSSCKQKPILLNNMRKRKRDYNQ